MSQPKLTISNSPASGGLVAIQTAPADAVSPLTPFAVLTTGVILPTYVGIGAPSATSLVAGAYYTLYCTYLDITDPLKPVPYLCVTSGNKTSSVWYGCASS